MFTVKTVHYTYSTETPALLFLNFKLSGSVFIVLPSL